MGPGEAASPVLKGSSAFTTGLKGSSLVDSTGFPHVPNTIRLCLAVFFNEAKRPDANNPGLKDNAA
jgi:hypothetical protein